MGLALPQHGQGEFGIRTCSTPRKTGMAETGRKRPRTSASDRGKAPGGKDAWPNLPRTPPSKVWDAETSYDIISRSRPSDSSRPMISKSLCIPLPSLRHGGEAVPETLTGSEKRGRISQEPHASSMRRISTKDSSRLSKAAEVMEEDRKKVSSIRAFLLNFLEERDCSIKKRLDLYVHQTETGRPVTDAVVQEVCKLRPDMISLSLRECVEVTDVALWCVARHTMALRDLNLSGCHNVTNIGLRSLAVCCEKMDQLDFTGCTRLTDLGLRVIGGGCWSLKSLSLEGCSHVSDSGVAEVAKMCTGLTYLNISGCERVGEYGDRALIQLGKTCHKLIGLDAFGCSHAQDPGLLAVARGCPKLEKLMLTGCGGITGKSVRALARRCKALRDLSLSGCGGVGNGDLRALAQGCTSLRHLNIAQCSQVNAQGLAALARGLKNLTELDVGGCEHVDDSALRALSNMNAHFLNLSGCKAISEEGVARIAVNCTALSSLNVTGCPSIGRRFMAGLCNSMRLSEPAQDFFGFQPRKNAKELLAFAEEQNRRVFAAVIMQSRMRGVLARKRADMVKRNWTVKTQLARAQAIVRGYFTRKWYRSWQAQGTTLLADDVDHGTRFHVRKVREHRAAASIQATWRMLCDRRTARRLRMEKLFRECGQGLATKIQAAWWGSRGRIRMKKIRAECARRLFLEARVQAKKELGSITIQSNWRRCAAQKALRDMQRVRDEALDAERKRQAAAVLIQSVHRMRVGRAALLVLMAKRDRKMLEWEMALRVQTAWHAKRARLLVCALRLVREEARQQAASIKIQCSWRAVRARHLTSIHRAMFKIRQKQGGAAIDIQRVYRGFKGRLRAKARRHVSEGDQAREAAALVIQRLYRGHKGRERFECKHHLRALEGQARPLQMKLEELSANAAALAERARRVAQMAELLRVEQVTFREELFHIRHTKDKYTDSDKINGCRQRFLTKFLRIRLVELKAASARKLDVLDAEALELEVKERHNTRLLRQTERELIPLGVGTVEKVKLLRTARLRKKVRVERSASTAIQRTFRGWRVRKAVQSWYRDYWIESQDAATGDVFYVNTWNQEVRWIKPLEMSLFQCQEGSTKPGATGSISADSEDDQLDTGFDSISSRFSHQHKQLTDEASFAAEQEAQLLRHAAATHGENAVAAASEWAFVRTDLAVAKTTCWYRKSTSEYFWGPYPPLDKFEDGHDRASGAKSKTAHSCISDRAAGEAWIQAQDLETLLASSETVREIGPAGWQQLRAPLPADVSAVSAVLAAGSTNASDLASTSTVKPEVRHLKAAHERGRGAHLEAEGDGEAEKPYGPISLAFYYHAERGEARWCLSPRTALAEPEIIRDAASAELSDGTGGEQSHGEVVEDMANELQSAASERSRGSALASEWELVEDDEYVFYYNKRTGISSWEPPPDWE